MSARHPLTESFKRAHSTILNSVDELQMVSRSYTQAKPVLRIFHEKILHHLGRQDQQMLDRLQEFYHNDREAVKMMEFLRHDLKDIKIKFLLFYDKHSGEMADINARSFPKDLQEFSEEIINRLKIEEEYLFPLLSRLPTGQAGLPEEVEG